MLPQPKLVVKKQLKQRTIIVEYADDKFCKYLVTDIFETNIVKKPKFLNFKKYFVYMTIVIANSIGLYFASEKFFIFLYTAVFCCGLFLWLVSYIDDKTNYEIPENII